MDKKNYKQIATFKDYCTNKKKKPIKENNEVAIDVPFWDDAVCVALNNLRELSASAPIEWEPLVQAIKDKFNLLGIFDKDLFNNNDALITAEVKDVLYFHFGKEAFLIGDTGTGFSSENGAKSLVLSQLAEKVLEQVKIESGIFQQPEPEESEPQVKVSLETYYDQDEEDYFEERKVAGFDSFSSMLKESVEKITLQHDEKALDYRLNKLEKDCGSLKMYDIIKVVEKEEFPDLETYLTCIVQKYLDNSKFEINGDKLKDKDEDRHVAKQAKKLFSHLVVQKLIAKIYEENPVEK